jgi:hypothetical protein
VYIYGFIFFICVNITMSLNKFSNEDEGYDLKLQVGADTIKCNTLDVVSDLAVGGDLAAESISLYPDYYPAGVVRPRGRVYVPIVSKTVVETSPTTIFDDAGAIGSRNVPANSVQVGDLFIMKASGWLTTNGTVNLTTQPRLQSAQWGGFASQAINSASRTLWTMEQRLVVKTLGAGGSCYVTCVFTYDLPTVGSSTFKVQDTVALDTTIDMSFDFRADWSVGDPANVLTCQTGSIELV